MLEDLVLAAHADAKNKLDEFTANEMKNATGGMQLPAGLKLPF
jgi:DNA-binding protein YbaB